MRRRLSVIVVGIIITSMVACNGTSITATPVGETNVPVETATATMPVPSVLTICLGMEPTSLYIYKSSSRSMWSVLEAIYDGPIDIRHYQPVPVILEKVPTFSDGDAVLQPIPVSGGDIVVDVNGDPVKLEKGVKVLPSGCTNGSCATTWDGTSTLTMDRIVANYVLKPGIMWSDGEPLKANDSVYSFNISADPATPVVKKLIYQTEAYQALDQRTVQWISRPGLITRYLEDYFWIPLPEHALTGKSAAELQTAPETNTNPLGWGPYVIDEWAPGDHIRLVKNPNYFRSGEGFPKFDVLVYRFIGVAANNNLSTILAGECDVVDQTAYWDELYQPVRQAVLDGKITAYVGLGPDWDHLDFGITPASYDDGYNPSAGDRPNVFGDKRVRQAFAYCMNRADATKAVFNSLSAVPISYLAPDHPLTIMDLPSYPYDTVKGNQLLDEAGWKDSDNNPETPRVAIGVNDVPDGTILVVNYAATEATIRQEYAKKMATSLADCGIQVNITATTRDVLYKAAPDGLLFGRKFDLGEFAWAAGREPPCFLYMSNEIPNAGNSWLGTTHGGSNAIGYVNPELDAACVAAQQAGLDESLYIQSQQQVMRILAEDLPSIPLFYFVKIAASRPDFCGMEMDVSTRSEMWNLEQFDFGSSCATQ